MQFTVGTEIEGKKVYVVLLYSRGEKVLFTHKMCVSDAYAFSRVLNAALYNADLNISAVVNGWRGEEE